jgi:hypothetical protein
MMVNFINRGLPHWGVSNFDDENEIIVLVQVTIEPCLMLLGGDR